MRSNLHRIHSFTFSIHVRANSFEILSHNVIVLLSRLTQFVKLDLGDRQPKIQDRKPFFDFDLWQEVSRPFQAKLGSKFDFKARVVSMS